MAFGTDESIAWKQFIGRHLHIYLANLRKLSVQFGGVRDQILGCVFLERLPIDVSLVLWASLKLGEMSIDQLLARAQTVLKVSENAVAAARMEEALSKLEECCQQFLCPQNSWGPQMLQVWWSQSSQECRNWRHMGNRNWNKPRCYRCNCLDHLTQNCPGNGLGSKATLPPLFTVSQ